MKWLQCPSVIQPCLGTDATVYWQIFLCVFKQRNKKLIKYHKTTNNLNTMLKSVSPQSNWAVLELWRQRIRQCIILFSAGFGQVPLHSRGGSSWTEWKLKEKKKAKEEGSILTRAGILEAVFKQGEECSVRGRIIAGGGEENIASSGNEGTGKTMWD